MANNSLIDAFRKAKHYGYNRLMTECEFNFKWYFDWAFLKIGAWNNVESGTSGPFGGDFYTLKPIKDPSYTDGQVWESVRKEWCFETGVNYQTPTVNISSIVANSTTGTISTSTTHNLSAGDTIIISDNDITDYNDTFTIDSVPSTTSIQVTGIAPSGTGSGGNLVGQFNPLTPSIWVNGTAISTGTAGLTHHINYPLGRVVFDSALNTGTDTVIAEYSYRNVQTYTADSVPWIVEMQFDSMDPSHTNWNDLDFIDKGEWGVNSPHRIQLPAIIIESVDSPGADPFELGNTSLVENQNILFHVLAQNRFERNNIINILKNQKHHTIYLFDTDEVARANDFPLDFRGMVKDNPPMYANIVSETGHRDTQIWFKDTISSMVQVNNPNLYIGRVRAILEIIIGDD